MMPTQVLCTWSLGSRSGWGVYGLNLAQQWASDPELRPIFAHVAANTVPVDPLRAARLSEILRESAEAAQILASDRPLDLNGVAIHALGNALHGGIAADRLRADTHIASVFFEDTALDEEANARAARFELIIAGSTWNTDILQAHSIGRAACVLQGVDPTLFHPGPRSGVFADRFLVFSGGKLEPRKGQDLVLKAFKLFAERHPEAMLVTAWHSPWPRLAEAFGRDNGLAPVAFDQNGHIDVVRWAIENGLEDTQIFDVGQPLNWSMPTILREMDAALFMSRCEGGTNLAAMECMACGIPTILSANTGHLDLLLDPGAARPLTRQGKPQAPAGFRGIDGWGESDVEEAVNALESIYVDRAQAAETGRRGAALLAKMSWAHQAGQLKQAIRPYLGHWAR